jgi:microcystin-dependent protein
MDMLMGMVIWFAGSFTPAGYLEANGQCLSVGQNTALFSIINNRYGGDGLNNFCLPDLRPKTDGKPDSNWNFGPRALIVSEGIYPNRP